MSNAEEQFNPINYPPTPRMESPVQFIQGWYYVIAGLWVAIGLSSLQSPAVQLVNLHHAWFIRLMGIVAVVIGVGLIAVSRWRRNYFLGTWAPIIFASVVTILNVVGMANAVLPSTFLVDLTMEIGFLVWWAVILYCRPSTIENPRTTSV